MEVTLRGEVWYWRGPAPFHYVTVPDEQSEALAAVASRVSYGWGMIPVTASIGAVAWETSLFPKDGGYLVPIKARVRAAADVELGDEVTIRLLVDDRPR